MDSKEIEKKKLQVVVRIRPQQKPDNVWVTVVDNHRLRTINHRNIDEALEYEFEHVFDPSASQEFVYQTCVRPLLNHVLKGQNASVFAYGPTGSGKTHTILGCESAPGIIPRCVQDIFSLIEHENNKPQTGAGCRFNVSYSYLEIYNEKVHDLLDPNPADLPIRQDRDRSLFVAGLSEKEIKSSEDFNQSFLPASQKRMTAATKLNAHSSRSHAVLQVKVLKTDMTCSPYRKLLSKVYIIDLAGSEDNRRTGNEGIRLKESGAINTSLFMLAEVVDALNKGKAVVPYRQSKLTRLLQDSLGGNSHSVMVVNVAPEEQHYLDTVSTLKLARKSKKIVNTIGTNEITEKSVEPKILNFPVKLESKVKVPVAVPLVEISNTCFSPLVRKYNLLEAEMKKVKLELESVKTQVSAGSLLPDSTVSSSSQLSNVSVETADSSLQKSPRRSPRRRALADINTDTLFNSPLCLPPIVKRRKNTTNSCAVETYFIPKVSSFDRDLPKERNAEVLALLNGSLRDLRTLQKIGEKKARLIYDWRALNGPLFSISDLQKIPGFSGFKSFLVANLIELD